MPMTSTLGRAAVGLAAAGATAGAWGLAEASAYTVRTHRVAALPPGSAPLRVLHLSDVHLLPWHRRRLAWLSRLGETRPDLVVNTGDNIASDRSITPLLEAFGPLLEVPGVFVPGSNDYYAPKRANPLRYFAGPSKVEASTRRRLDSDGLFGRFVEAGWRDLTNRSVSVEVGSAAPLEVLAAGTDDPHLGLDEFGGFTAATHGPSDEVFTLGVTHAPYRRVLDAMVTDGADMVLAGHTHGGQVCLPFFGALVTNCDLPRRQASGLSTWSAGGRTVPLEVSAGIGAAPAMPLRFACRPEAVVLDLVARL